MLPVLRAVLIAVVVLAVLVAVFVWLRARLREAGIYVIPRTKFGMALVFNVEGDDGEPVRVLNVGGMYQSATYLDDRYTDLVFEYDRLFDRMFDAGIPIGRALMIGGGGYAYPKHFIASNPDAHLDVVEIDPKITQVARRYFFLDRLVEEYGVEESGRLGLVAADGRAYLDDLAAALGANPGEADGDACARGRARYGEAFGERYDVVVNDSFRGKSPVPTLVTAEAARSAHACLNPGGLYLANVVSAVEGDGAAFLRAVVATFGTAFEHVYVVPCGKDELADRDNNVVIATDGAYRFTGAHAVEPGPEDPVLHDGDPLVERLAG